MKLRNMFTKAKSLPKRMMLVALAAAITLPSANLAVTAQNQVLMEGHTQALNVTAGETEYKDVTNAMVDEVVQVQLWQHNRELPEGAKATNNRVKFTVPNAPGATQVISGTSSADNANTVTDTTTVNLSLERARIEYMSGTAMFRYNKGAQDGNPACITGMNFPPAECYATVAISDEVVANGVNLDAVRGGPLHGCNAYHETVTIQVRVKADVVSIQKFVRHLGQAASDWKLSATAKPGDDLEYKIQFKNEGNTQLNDVMVGDNMPMYNTYVDGTTKLYNGNHPNGLAITNDNITRGGINVGNYGVGSSAYVIIQVKLDAIHAYERCGQYDVRNVGVVRPAGMNEFFNTAQVLINVECEDDEQEQPAFDCTGLRGENLGNRKMRFTTSTTATNGATVSRYIYNFGDGTQELRTDRDTVEHTYARDGQYVARVGVEFSVDGQTQTVNKEVCSVPVGFSTPTTTTTTPGQPTTLPAAGAGSVVLTFLVVTTASTMAYYYIAARRSVA